MKTIQIEIPEGKEAKWVNAHPQWHKYPEEKPTEGKPYLVYTIYLDAYKDYYDISKNEWFYFRDSSIIAWMELPEPPKFD